MMDVLFIALEFAPIQRTGAFRSTHFARFLPPNGIRPIVLTIDPNDASQIFGSPINQSLSVDVPCYYLRDSRPYLNSTTPLRRYLRGQLRTSDGFYARLRTSLHEQIGSIVEKHRLKAIYVSLPPFGAGRLAMDVAVMTGLPLIVDMRDAWSQWANTPFPSYMHYRLALRQERQLLAKADAIVTVTDELSRMFQRSHPAISEHRFHVIPNGIDSIPPHLTCQWGDEPDRFKVAYVGSYYFNPTSSAARHKKWFLRRPHRWLHCLPVEQDWLYRTPYFFFSALHKLRKINPEAANRFQFHQIGDTPSWLTDMATRFGVSGQLVSHGVVPHEKVVQVLAAMDACLVTSIKVPDGDDYCLASKTFDYVKARRLMLGFVSTGAQQRFLKQVEGSVIFDSDEVDKNALTLAHIVNRGARYEFDRTVLQRYDRRVLTSRLAGLLSGHCDSTVGGRRG